MARNPVLLVHGIDDTAALFDRMKPHLECDGFSVSAPNLVPNDGAAALDELARQLDRYICATFAQDETIDLVAFSMGGLISRYYLQRLGGIHRVRNFVTIGTPHRGTWTAFLRDNPGARNMRPKSAFLEDLRRDVAVLGTISFTSVWTPLDLMIIPASSSLLPVGRAIRVVTAAHPLLVRDRRVLNLVTSILKQ